MGKLADLLQLGYAPPPGRQIRKKDIGTYFVEESAGDYTVIAKADQYRERYEYLGGRSTRYVLDGSIIVMDSDGKQVVAGAIMTYKPHVLEGDNPLHDRLFDYRGRAARTPKQKEHCVNEIIKSLREQRRSRAGVMALLTQRLPRGAP